MGSHSVTCHPAELTFPPLPQPKPVLDLATREGCKAELTQLHYTRLRAVPTPTVISQKLYSLTRFYRGLPW